MQLSIAYPCLRRARQRLRREERDIAQREAAKAAATQGHVAILFLLVTGAAEQREAITKDIPAVAAARRGTAGSIERLVELRESSDEQIATVASKALWEISWGRPKDYDPKSDIEATSRPRFDPKLLTPEQLDLVEHALRLMVQATRAPTGFAEVDTGRSDGCKPER